MVSIQATPKFMQLAKKTMTTLALQELIDQLTCHPEQGVLIKDTGGIRKLRWYTGKSNQGKSGGIRVIYYHDHNRTIVLLISLFKKSDRENIDPAEKAQLKKMLPELLRSYCHE